MSNIVNLKFNQAFHILAEAFFKHQSLPYQRSEIYDLALTLPGEETTPLVLMPLNQDTGLFLSKIPFESTVDEEVLRFFMTRNQLNQQSCIQYALNTDQDGNTHIMAQSQFNLSAIELPDLINIYENYITELTLISQQLETLKK
ncbi:hypothetical protein [uncultured Shewanella sp.]|uniref:hypothetical protein n=1 Tax=uncultured Shewanella sp. TaxID=173975 RepID=UPI002626BF2D|nr:hypothetical protein [uncultured Shewanella sp.]